jgi:hypothetical protein
LTLRRDARSDAVSGACVDKSVATIKGQRVLVAFDDV